jgi:hypothetical protein
MTPTDLRQLIASDTQATAYFAAGNDEACAARCTAIAPSVRQPVPADTVQQIASLNGMWGMLKIAALNTSLSNPPRGAAVSFVDWIERGRPLNVDNPAVQQMAATLISYSLATAAQIAELSDAANVPQTITFHDVGAARQEGSVTGGAT